MLSGSRHILDMQQAVMSFVKNNLPKDINKAHLGVINGSRVIIGNKSYPFVPTVDVFFADGDSVYCILPDSGNIAAVVGVA